MSINIYNEKFLLILSFSMGLFINIGTIYLCVIVLLSNYSKLIHTKSYNELYNSYSDYILSFLAGVIIHHIYIPMLLLSIIIGGLFNDKIGVIDISFIKNKIGKIKELLKNLIVD